MTIVAIIIALSALLAAIVGNIAANQLQNWLNDHMRIRLLPRTVKLSATLFLFVLFSIPSVIFQVQSIKTSTNPNSTETPLPITPATTNEILILVANFDRAEGIPDARPQDKIRKAIQQAINDLELKNVRVENLTIRIKSSELNEARNIAKSYGARIIIWGEETSVDITVKLLNVNEFIGTASLRSQGVTESFSEVDDKNNIKHKLTYFTLPYFIASSETITGTEKQNLIAAYSDPIPYKQFITKELPGQLTFYSLLVVGQASYVRKEFNVAARVIERALESLPMDSKPDGLANVFIELGRLYCLLGESQKAFQTSYLAARLAPEFGAVLAKLRDICFQSQQMEEALVFFTDLIGIDPENSGLYLARGNAYQQIGKYDESISDIDKAIELDPLVADSYYIRGLDYVQLEKWQQALNDFTKAIELDPKQYAAYYNRGLIYHDLNKPDAALLDYSQSIKLAPKGEKAYFMRGELHRELGELDKAISDYSAAIELTSHPQFYNSRGIAYYDQGKYDLAIDDQTKAIELGPNISEFYRNRGDAYGAKKEFQSALADLNMAVTLDPDNIPAYLSRGNIYKEIGRVDEARVNYEKGLNSEYLSYRQYAMQRIEELQTK